MLKDKDKDKDDLEIDDIDDSIESEGEKIISESLDDEDMDVDVLEVSEEDLEFGKDVFVDEIDIDDEDIDEDIESIDVIDEVKDDIVLSKHAVEGKHSLKYDSIFKGKKEELNDNEDFDIMSSNEKFEVDKASQYWFESIDNENYTKEKRVKERVYEVLSQNTDINFLNNRRKPSRVDFNQYYHLLKMNLKKENFTNIEIFNELSVYFSDNLFNMFKLLDNKWRNMIINELQDHIGKKNYSNEIADRNVHKGTEIEFEWIINNTPKIITGVVVDIDHETFEYRIDSYENIYIITIEHITKILNNSKFKYNLNKLNNIDFL